MIRVTKEGLSQDKGNSLGEGEEGLDQSDFLGETGFTHWFTLISLSASRTHT